MDRDLMRDWQRWLAADQAGREDEADAAFRTVFQAVPRRAPRPGFSGRVMQALAARPDARARARWPQLAAIAGLATLTVVATGWAAVTVTPLVARLFVGAISLAAETFVWVLVAFEGGLDVWGVLSRIGGALGTALATPQVTAALVAVELVGAAALYALHRLLASEKESA